MYFGILFPGAAECHSPVAHLKASRHRQRMSPRPVSSWAAFEAKCAADDRPAVVGVSLNVGLLEPVGLAEKHGGRDSMLKRAEAPAHNTRPSRGRTGPTAAPNRHSVLVI